MTIRQTPTILVVEDDAENRTAMVKVLEAAGYHVRESDNGQQALDMLYASSIDILLTDLRMPVMDGAELLKRAKALGQDIEVILITGYGTVEIAVEAIKDGAYDFITKPVKKAQLLRAIEKAAEKQYLSRENRELRQQLGESGARRIIYVSAQMRNIVRMVEQVAPSTATVLITGESGTGKEVIADAIHGASPRRLKPLIKVSCAALPDTLLESELFGYEKGAFTGANTRKEGRFELANSGTLFLDEIGDLSLVTQPKILRVLQEGEFERLGGTRSLQVDVRIVAATNQDLSEMVKEKRFREDLYYRLNVISVRVPPLRERHEDIRVLAQHYLRVYAAKNGRKLEGFSNEALERLESYAWPGNVRELENLIERTVLLARKDRLDAEDLPEEVAGVKRPPRDAILELVGTPLDEIERRLLDETLRITGGNKTQAAKLLGIDVRTVARKLERRDDDVVEGGDRP